VSRPVSFSALVLALLTLVLGGCSGGSSGERTPGVRTSVANPSGGPGVLIIANQQGLVEYRLKDGSTRQLLAPATPSTFLLDPAVSPNGKRLAYIVQPPPNTQGGRYDAGSDLWVADRDGSNARELVKHFQPNQLIRFPQWQDNDNVLVIVQEIGTAGGTTRVDYRLTRVDAASGERTPVRDDVLAFGVSPDATQVAYAKLSLQSGETLAIFNLAGGDADRTLVGTDENLAPFAYPRWRPDGKQIAFASADQTGARLAPGASTAREVAWSRVAARPAPLLDGLPQDIWTVDPAGGRPVRVANLKEDLPALTWSGDGEHIYVLGTAGLYDVKLKSGAVDRIGEGAFHGQLTWAP
jgi:dipeptidyl aminopeptidase/acylaminoacyl peptidase